MTTELTAKEKIRLGLLKLTSNNTTATARAIKLIKDDQLEYELFCQLWSTQMDNGDTVTKVDSVYQRVQETKKTLFNDEVAE
ncbi:DUF2560 family protein [Providencia rettgeri]|uniref:DUF2560 family protein n=1 Tax=Providencia TaxID=586 RepID=UPI000F6CF649|nr:MULTISPECIES: DUF2560 family protein [Providencia]MBI6193349.1 DUF2560 family protein [Providencia rettgeri]MCL0015674.1 DUF2560 family protein [Providencia rettgeri]MTC60386.1 DUF2560 family protein [Providencia rustigianii]WOB87365.1 DUF2560 family protein [Providencia sp. PROV040]VEH55056.1 Protein of uncharacterised function (DUF2560) [Providencia rustigianii]